MRGREEKRQSGMECVSITPNSVSVLGSPGDLAVVSRRREGEQRKKGGRTRRKEREDRGRWVDCRRKGRGRGQRED